MPRLVLVHDWLNQVGGAEDVLTELVSMYPNAPVYTSLYDRQRMPSAWREWTIKTLWMDRLPGIYAHHQRYLPLYPLAFGGLHLHDYEVILSNKSGFCHGVRGGKNTVHVCYCLAPTRYVWQFDAYVEREQLGKATRALLRPIIRALRRWDYAAAQRVTHFLAISTEIQERIQRYYGRSSTILFPPVDTERFASANAEGTGDYFLVVSRLIPYKRIDLAVEACSRLGVRLLVAGRGRDQERLAAMAGPTVEFLGYVPDADLPALMAGCKAFLFPGLEDFGITPVQANAAGRPVIAYRGGGTLDTVIPGETGAFFTETTVESLMGAIQHFIPSAYDSETCRTHARRFDRTVFREQLTAFMREKANLV
ncbi:MAG TPA: glycosyltransferase [Aggregatilineales bacterium]|nr:glycosyltransferase [Anaerolineales bacterium]HRE47308.1 glycosyltransferase [Aggregatilineales bacterium]